MKAPFCYKRTLHSFVIISIVQKVKELKMNSLYALVVLSFLSIAGSSSSSSSDSSSISKIRYTYILWFGDNVDKKYSIHLKSPKGIFFIDAMNQAAAKNSHFAYNATDFPPYGKFINSINKISSDTVK